MPFGRLDEPNVTDGDLSFRGVWERGSPADVPPGFVHRAKNKRFREGKAETRRGVQVLPCGPVDGVTPWSTPQGVSVFYDASDRLLWVIVVAEGKVWRTRPNNVAVEVSLPAGETVTNFKQFVQTAGALIMLRGPTEAPLVCTELDSGFQVIEDPEGLEEPIPPSSFGMYLANRTLLVKNEYDLAVSEIGEYTEYIAVTNTFRINQGDYDTLIGLGSYQEGVLVCFKRNSVWKVGNFIGDVGANAVGPVLVTDQYGCVAPFSVVRVGRNLFWWAEGGVASLALTDQNVIQAQESYLTDVMTHTLGRINRQYVSQIRAAQHGSYLYFAVPLDEAKIYGDQLVPAGQIYSTGVATSDPITGITVKYYQQAVTAGRKYRWVQGNRFNDVYVENGSAKYYGPTEFVAAGSYVRFYGRQNVNLEVELQEVTAEGVLNGVLVYDTIQQAWAGVDEGDAIQIVDWVKVEIQGKQELACLGRDGFLRWYGYDYEDEILQEVATPYAEVLINANVAIGETFQVNGGTLVTGVNSPNTVGGNWLVSGPVFGDILRFASFPPCYFNFPASEWTAPNTTRVQVGYNSEEGNPDPGGGVRFVSTNGVLPEIKVNGVTITETGLYGTNNWAYVELHSGEELTRVPVEDYVLSRGYGVKGATGDRYQTLRALTRTWWPTYEVSAIADGVENARVVREETTPSRTAYVQPAGQEDWNERNVNGDFATAGREDYAVILPDQGMYLDPAGVALDVHQDGKLMVSMNEVGAYLQIAITNTRGRHELRAIQLDSVTGDQTFGQRL